MFTQEEFEEYTRFYPVLRELPLGLQQELLNSSHRVQAAAGEVLIDFDTVIQSFLLIIRGSIRIMLPGKERDLLLYRMEPGICCVFSICHLMGGTQYRTRAEVETPIQGIALPRSLFEHLMEQSAPFRSFIFQTFTERFTQLIELVEEITSMRLDARLAELLLSRGPVVQTTHSRLANELGSVREVISRILKDFETKGLIKLGRGQIQVLNPGRLKNLYWSGYPGH